MRQHYGKFFEHYFSLFSQYFCANIRKLAQYKLWVNRLLERYVETLILWKIFESIWREVRRLKNTYIGF